MLAHNDMETKVKTISQNEERRPRILCQSTSPTAFHIQRMYLFDSLISPPLGVLFTMPVPFDVRHLTNICNDGTQTLFNIPYLYLYGSGPKYANIAGPLYCCYFQPAKPEKASRNSTTFMSYETLCYSPLASVEKEPGQRRYQSKAKVRELGYCVLRLAVYRRGCGAMS
jgi:hypothetical protein